MGVVEISGQGWGWVADVSGNGQAGVTVQIDDTDGNPATHYSSLARSSPSTSSLTTNSDGTIPRFIDEGSYDLTAGGITRRVEAVAGSTVVLAESKIAGVINVKAAAYGAVGNGVTDDTAAIQAALDAAEASASEFRIVHIPKGQYVFDQLVIPRRVLVTGDGCWGNYGSLFGTGFETASNTFLFQKAGANKDAILFERNSVGVDYAGPSGIVGLQIQQEASNTSGSGVVLKDPDGTALATQDGFVIRDVHVGGFAENGFEFYGGVPLHVDGCRAFACAGYGLDYVSSGNDQGIHLDNFSGDQNGNGLVRLKGVTTGTTGAFVVTNLKSEKKANIYRTGGKQENAIVFEDMVGARVIVDGITHVSADPTEGPGAAMKVTAANATPAIDFRAVTVRVSVGQSSTNAYTLQDLNASKTVPNTVSFGYYGNGGRLVEATAGANLRRVLGNSPDYQAASTAGEHPGFQLNGSQPVLSLFNSSAGTNRQHTVWVADSAGQVTLRTFTSAGAADEDVIALVRTATAGTSTLKLGSASAAAKVGFFGGAGATKPTVTGSRGGNAALASLLTALASLGLIVDSSSA